MLRHLHFLLTSLLSVNWISTFSIIMLLLEFRFDTAILHYLLHRYECYALGFFAFIYSYVFSCYKTYELFFFRVTIFAVWCFRFDSHGFLLNTQTDIHALSFVTTLMSLCTVCPLGNWHSPHLLGFVTEWCFRVTFFFYLNFILNAHIKIWFVPTNSIIWTVSLVFYNTLHTLSLRKFIKCLLRLTTLLQVQEKYFSIEIR